MGDEFRYLDGDEQQTVLQFVEQGSAAAIERMQELLERLRMEFALTAPLAPERERARRKLLDIAGIYQLIDVGVLRRRLAAHQIVSAAAVSAPPDLRRRAEIPPAALSLIPGLARLLQLQQWPNEITYGDVLKAARDEENSALIDWVVFDADLSADCGLDVSASSEPLTRTVFIKSVIPDGELRDPVTIFFDLLLQTAYLSSFWHTVERLDALQARYEMLHCGLEFALDVLRLFFASPWKRRRPDVHDEHAPYVAFIITELVFGTVQKMGDLGVPGADPEAVLQQLLAVKQLRRDDLERLQAH